MENKCLKTKFATEKDANFYIDKLQKTSVREKKPIRAYHCWCGSWHLSSKKSFAELSGEIELLEKENDQLKKELEDLKKEMQVFDNVNSRMITIEARAIVRKDETVTRLQRQIDKQNHLIRRLRRDNSDMIARLANKKE